jgi:hypothetical protein
MKYRQIWWGTLAGFALALPAVAAEEPVYIQNHKRDPFTASDTMHALVGNQAANAANSGRGFIVGGADQIPKMRLRGFVNNKKSVAVLDIQGVGTYLVRENDEIGLQAIGRNTVIKIIEVSGMGVKVQSGTFRQVIVVR